MKHMKKWTAAILAVITVFTLSACGAKEEYDPVDDICPGKQPGVAGNTPVRAEGFDPKEDMSFETKDTKGNTVTHEVFSGTERGVWVVFWRTDNEKSADELEKLNGLTDVAKEHGYKILGVVMDGAGNEKKAAELTDGLSFENVLWNDSMAERYSGVADFFSKEFFEENKENFAGLDQQPQLGDPVSTRTNSRGQLQTSCYLVPLSAEKLTDIWKENDNNLSYEEFSEKEQAALK